MGLQPGPISYRWKRNAAITACTSEIETCRANGSVKATRPAAPCGTLRHLAAPGRVSRAAQRCRSGRGAALEPGGPPCAGRRARRAVVGDQLRGCQGSVRASTCRFWPRRAACASQKDVCPSTSSSRHRVSCTTRAARARDGVVPVIPGAPAATPVGVSGGEGWSSSAAECAAPSGDGGSTPSSIRADPDPDPDPDPSEASRAMEPDASRPTPSSAAPPSSSSSTSSSMGTSSPAPSRK